MTKIPLGCSGQIAAIGEMGGRRAALHSREQTGGPSPFLSLPSSPEPKKQELSSWRERRKRRFSRLPASHLWQPHSAGTHAWLCLYLLRGALALSASLLFAVASDLLGEQTTLSPFVLQRVQGKLSGSEI